MTYVYETVMGGKNLVVEYCYSSMDNCIKVVEMTVDGKFHRVNWMSNEGKDSLMSELTSDYNGVDSFVDDITVASYDSEIDLDRDIWTYISLDYFKQKIIKGEVGSSAMPHKVNPIDFENSEGNFGVANALLGHFAEKLPISRMQRDLTDSTVLRNVGVPLGHAIIALKSLQKGLGKLLINEAAFAYALEANWAVVSEGVQTILRREGYPKPYEALKALTRTGEAITSKTMSNFIDTLDVSDSVKSELKAINRDSAHHLQGR